MNAPNGDSPDKIYPDGQPEHNQGGAPVSMTWKEIAHALWGLLDDISTAGDMVKGNDQAYRRKVGRIQERRSLYLVSHDGYTLTPMVAIEGEGDVARARAIIKAAFDADPDFRRTWADNVAMFLRDNFPDGTYIVAETPNVMADRILDLLFEA